MDELAGPGEGTLDSETNDAGADMAVADTSAADSDLVETHVADSSLVETSIADSSLAETSLADGSLVETSIADSSLAETSLADGSLAETTIADGSLAETQVADADAGDTNGAEMADSGDTQTSTVDTDVADTTVTDTGTDDTQVADTKAADTAAPDSGSSDTSSPDSGAVDSSDTGSSDSGATCGVSADAASTALPYTNYIWAHWPIAADGRASADFTVTTSCGDKVVTDKTTALMWAQDDEVYTFNWADAKARCANSRRGGFTDWRLPTRIELLSLLDFTKPAAPMINSTAFPGETGWSSMWTSSPFATSSGGAWAVNFGNGLSAFSTIGYQNAVRCVRALTTVSGQRYALLNGDTEVQDNHTGLIWWRANDAIAVSWEGAKTRCANKGGGYRLPTIRELQSIVDETVTSGPTIDRTAFSDATGATKWSSTPSASTSGNAWHLSFSSGGASPYAAVESLESVRCVR